MGIVPAEGRDTQVRWRHILTKILYIMYCIILLSEWRRVQVSVISRKIEVFGEDFVNFRGNCDLVDLVVKPFLNDNVV